MSRGVGRRRGRGASSAAGRMREGPGNELQEREWLLRKPRSQFRFRKLTFVPVH